MAKTQHLTRNETKILESPFESERYYTEDTKNEDLISINLKEIESQNQNINVLDANVQDDQIPKEIFTQEKIGNLGNKKPYSPTPNEIYIEEDVISDIGQSNSRSETICS